MKICTRIFLSFGTSHAKTQVYGLNALSSIRCQSDQPSVIPDQWPKAMKTFTSRRGRISEDIKSNQRCYYNHKISGLFFICHHEVVLHKHRKRPLRPFKMATTTRHFSLLPFQKWFSNSIQHCFSTHMNCSMNSYFLMDL